MKSSYRNFSGVAAAIVMGGLAVGQQLRGEEISGDEVNAAPSSTSASALGGLTDALPQVASPEAKPDFQIESCQVKRVYVVEAAEMPELPPVEGVITLTIHKVIDPGLPDPLPPLPPDEIHEADDHGEVEGEVQETQIAFVSATVYDHSRTLLRCRLNGRADFEITAWSNVDFNHLQGLGVFEATGGNGERRSYALLMSLGNENTAPGREEIPAIPDAPPAFVIQSKDPDPESLVLIEDLHAL